MEQARFFRVTLATCLLLAAGLFAVGTAVERSGGTGHKEPAIESPHEGGGEGATGEGTPSQAGSNSSGERIFGIDRESGPLVALGIAISLALALAVVLTRSAAPLGIAVAFAVAFAAFDLAEVVHQVGESRGGLAALAALIAVLHVGAGAAGVIAFTRERSGAQVA